MTRFSNRRLGVDAAEEVAERLGARRIRSYTPGAPDIVGPWFVIEVETSQKVGQVPYRALTALRASTAEKDLPLYVYKHPDWRNWVVSMLLSDFVAFFGSNHPVPTPTETLEGRDEVP